MNLGLSLVNLALVASQAERFCGRTHSRGHMEKQIPVATRSDQTTRVRNDGVFFCSETTVDLELHPKYPERRARP